MLWAPHFLEDRQGAFEEGPCPRKVALVSKQVGEVVDGLCGVRMHWAEYLLADSQCALVKRPRARKITLVLKQVSKVVEALRSIGMLGAEHLLLDHQSALVERLGLCIGTQCILPVLPDKTKQTTGQFL